MVGVRVGDYQVVEALGGASGGVYKAQHAGTGRLVVLKFLPDGLSGHAVAVERFRSQAESLAAVTHPSVVQVLGPGSADHRHYAAMAFVEGETLDALVEREGPLPPVRALALQTFVWLLCPSMPQAVSMRGMKWSSPGRPT